MVVNFSNLSEHIQVAIAKKMAFWDMRNFEMSSSNGKSVTSFASECVVFPADGIRVSTDEIFIDVSNKIKDAPVAIEWNSISLLPSIPRFSLSAAVFYFKNLLDQAVELAESGRFLFKKTSIYWFIDDHISPTDFNRILELFNVTMFSLMNVYFDQECYRAPKLQEVEYLNLVRTTNLPDDIFLALKAKTVDIEALNLPRNICSTLNLFLQQWYTTKREIQSLNFYGDGLSGILRIDELFTNIPFSLVWSIETHSSSMISDIPLENIAEHHKESVIHRVCSGEKKLFVNWRTDYLIAYERDDERKMLLELFNL